MNVTQISRVPRRGADLSENSAARNMLGGIPDLGHAPSDNVDILIPIFEQ